MPSDLVGQLIIYIVVLLLAISAHEAAHAWMSYKFGDDTAYLLGRVTLNPVAHTDPIGTLLIPIINFVAAVGMGVFVPLIAGVLYGALWGSVLTAIGTAIGSAAAFWIGRGAGRRVAERWIGEEALEQAQVAIRGKRWLALIPLFIFPFSPADALCFMSGIAGVSWPQFLAAVLFGRIPKDVVIAISAAMGWNFLGNH